MLFSTNSVKTKGLKRTSETVHECNCLLVCNANSLLSSALSSGAPRTLPRNASIFHMPHASIFDVVPQALSVLVVAVSLTHLLKMFILLLESHHHLVDFLLRDPAAFSNHSHISLCEAVPSVRQRTAHCCRVVFTPHMAFSVFP